MASTEYEPLQTPAADSAIDVLYVCGSVFVCMYACVCVCWSVCARARGYVCASFKCLLWLGQDDYDNSSLKMKTICPFCFFYHTSHVHMMQIRVCFFVCTKKFSSEIGLFLSLSLFFVFTVVTKAKKRPSDMKDFKPLCCHSMSFPCFDRGSVDKIKIPFMVRKEGNFS